MNEWITYITKYFRVFVPASVMTLKVTTFGILIGILLGLFFALMRISKYRALTIPAKAYIWVIRGTPLLLQLLLIYYGLVGVVKMDNLPAAFVALGVHNGAYIAEIFRGAIQSVDRGQTEAGVSLGMTKWRVMRRIIFPQAFKRALPSLSNQFIIALKDSSLASSIAVPELLLKAKQIGSANFKLMESLSVAAIFYLVMTSVLTIITGLIEHALKTSSRQA
ncbi:amino acid ABC transporter permease [Caproicibacter sp.]|uniref:amino acid ABC transporter permease n=1 Tax=Caproicibacter sp. TaxID=2814884 RepID=UPI003988B41A